MKHMESHILIDANHPTSINESLISGVVAGVIVLFLLLVVSAGYVVKHLRDENRYLNKELTKVRERERTERAQMFKEVTESIAVLNPVVDALDKTIDLLHKKEE